jgi:hypothetical protein
MSYEQRLGLSRRTLLRNSVGGFLGYALARQADPSLLLAQEATRAAGKSLIVLWMSGGPSQFETWSPLEGRENGGPTKALETSVKGIHYAETMKVCAKQAEHIAVVRSMSSREGSHERGRYLLHTGYVPTGTVTHPSLGAVTAMEIGKKDLDLPNFISIGGPTEGAGFLSPEHNPFVVNSGGGRAGADGGRRGSSSGAGIPNVAYGPGVDAARFRERMKMLKEQEAEFEKERASDEVTRHRTAYVKADKLMHTPLLEAFDLSKEKPELAARYGDGAFGKGCLLARRLIERGVACVEVNLGGWDTHQDNFTRVKNLSGQVDPAMSALVNDLKERGLLDSTLVVWMGDFGRTPKINSRGDKPGRDHYPRAWSSVMIGGGIKGGQVIGKTDKEGAVVEERPINVLDFMSTVCKVLGIDYQKQNQTPIGRPIRIVDKGANPIKELF